MKNKKTRSGVFLERGGTTRNNLDVIRNTFMVRNNRNDYMYRTDISQLEVRRLPEKYFPYIVFRVRGSNGIYLNHGDRAIHHPGICRDSSQRQNRLDASYSCNNLLDRYIIPDRAVLSLGDKKDNPRPQRNSGYALGIKR